MSKLQLRASSPAPHFRFAVAHRFDRNEMRVMSGTGPWLMRKEGMWRSSVPLELAGGGRFVIPHDEFVPAYVKTYEE
jgi:hypothetical protein